MLREIGDIRPNGVLKVDYINSLRERGFDPVLFYEDWPEAARMIQEKTGVPVLGINPFYEEDDIKLQSVAGDVLGGGL